MCCVTFAVELQHGISFNFFFLVFLVMGHANMQVTQPCHLVCHAVNERKWEYTYRTQMFFDHSSYSRFHEFEETFAFFQGFIVDK
jgi:hypothetical protein